MVNSETQKHTPPRVAITGGIGSGKSTALTMFGARRAAVLNSDHVVHRLLQRRDVREQVAARLGIPDFPGGDEGRAQLADAVFSDRARLDKLQEIMFPLVRREMEEWFDSPEVKSAPLAVVELPMLFEAGMEDMFDCLVLITAPTDVRRGRHSGRVASAEFERRAAHQMPEDEKRTRCTAVFENTGSPDDLDRFVEETFGTIMSGGDAMEDSIA